MKQLSRKVRLCLVTIPFVTQLCVAAISLVCSYCGFTLMLRDAIRGAEIDSSLRLNDKVLGYGILIMNSAYVRATFYKPYCISIVDNWILICLLIRFSSRLCIARSISTVLGEMDISCLFQQTQSSICSCTSSDQQIPPM